MKVPREWDRRRWRRIALLLGIFAYVACFQWMYENYLYPVWDYAGFHYEIPPAGYLALAWILALVPSLWMPMELTRPSQLAYWALYIMVFIPSMFVPLYAGLDAPAEIRWLMLALFVGLAIAGLSYRFPLIRFRPGRISRRHFWNAFLCLAAVLGLWLAFVFRHHLRLVSFGDVYDVRNDLSDLAEGKPVNFAFMLLTGAINPFLMGCGLHYRRKGLLAAGALGQLLVYSAGGTKGSILSILFVPALYFLFHVKHFPFALKMTFGNLALVGSLCICYRLAGFDAGPALTMVLFVVLMRTFSANALMTAWYYDFFQWNPHTFFSHLRFVNWFVHFPYQNSIGEEVGWIFIGKGDVDATANFWAIDGLGGLGLSGVLLISVFCALVFWTLDSAAQRHDPRLAALVTTYAAYNLANISIFTTLYSGGLALLILALWLMPPEGRADFGLAGERARRSILPTPRARPLPIAG